jgi:hypothetical protein
VLNERRVEMLLLVEGLSASGPADGGELERRDDVVESAIELAIVQSAEVLVARHHGQELERHGGVGALLRF